MRTTSFAKVAALCGLLALSGCASKITQPDKYSGFLNNYYDLQHRLEPNHLLSGTETFDPGRAESSG